MSEPIDLWRVRIGVNEEDFKKLLKHLRTTYAIEGGLQIFVPGVCALDLRVEGRENGKVILRPKPLGVYGEAARTCIKEGLKTFKAFLDNVKDLIGVRTEVYIKEYLPEKLIRISWRPITGEW